MSRRTCIQYHDEIVLVCFQKRVSVLGRLDAAVSRTLKEFLIEH